MASAKMYSRCRPAAAPVEAAHDLSKCRIAVCSASGCSRCWTLNAAAHHRANAMLSQFTQRPTQALRNHSPALLRDRAAPCHKGALHIVDCSRPPARPALRRGRPMSAFTAALAIRHISRSSNTAKERLSVKPAKQPHAVDASSLLGDALDLQLASTLPFPSLPPAPDPTDGPATSVELRCQRRTLWGAAADALLTSTQLPGSRCSSGSQPSSEYEAERGEEESRKSPA